MNLNKIDDPHVKKNKNKIVMKKGGSELLHANYVARTNFQSNMTLQLLLTQCLLSTLRITPPPASPIWSFDSLFSSYANYCYSHIRSPQTHIPLFFLFPTVKHRCDVSNLFHYFLDHKNIAKLFFITIFLFVVVVVIAQEISTPKLINLH